MLHRSERICVQCLSVCVVMHANKYVAEEERLLIVSLIIFKEQVHCCSLAE